jgi:hypothetical protein
MRARRRPGQWVPVLAAFEGAFSPLLESRDWPWAPVDMGCWVFGMMPEVAATKAFDGRTVEQEHGAVLETAFGAFFPAAGSYVQDAFMALDWAHLSIFGH